MVLKRFHALVLIGTRPDGIKLAPLTRELLQRDELRLSICNTGQHRELLDQVLMIFGIRPDFSLELMQENQSLPQLSNALLTKLTDLLFQLKPDFVIVHGDTTTAFIGALSAFYCKIPVVHIEAGLRTNDILQPFPEEFNRQAIARIASLHFCPTVSSMNNLIAEGIRKELIIMSGNTIVDSLAFIKQNLESSDLTRLQVYGSVDHQVGFNIRNNKFVLITLHRRENFGGALNRICDAVKQLAILLPSVKFIFPVHKNPNVESVVFQTLGSQPNIKLINPLPYDQFISLMIESLFIISDSGGIQEEAVSLEKVTLVCREETERPEGVDLGLLVMVGSDPENIVKHALSLINGDTQKKKSLPNPFGSGKVSESIVNELIVRFPF